MMNEFELLKSIKPIEQGALKVGLPSRVGFKFSKGAQAVTVGKVTLNFGIRNPLDCVRCFCNGECGEQ